MKNLERFYTLPENSFCANKALIPRKYTGWVHYDQDSVYKNPYKIYIHYVNGFKESLDGKPSYIEMLARDPTKLFRVSWHSNDLLHRVDGPATIYCENDNADEYHINGNYFEITEYWTHPMVVQYMLENILKTLV